MILIDGKYIAGSDGIVYIQNGEIAWDYYVDWFRSDPEGFRTMVGSNDKMTAIAAATPIYSMGGLPIAGSGGYGSAKYIEKAATGPTSKVTITNQAKGTGNTLRNIKDLDDILTDPSKLKGIKPDDLHKYLKDNGYNPQPLSGGSLKGKTFEDGGGFKVNWGGDRILQYHPGSKHHGNVPYFKLSSGKTGTQRYDMQGNLIK